MITCLGLVVGVVESASRNDLAKQCAKFLNEHSYIDPIGAIFEVERTPYLECIQFAIAPDDVECYAFEVIGQHDMAFACIE